MKVHFDITSTKPLCNRGRASKFEIELYNVNLYEKVPYIEDISSWRGENYMTSDIGLTGKLRINRGAGNITGSVYDLDKYLYEFWININLYNKSENTSRFLAWNHLQKSYLDSAISAAILEIRDMNLIKILD